MTWQPGQPVITSDDMADWEAWKRARKLEQQRQRRHALARIDYYPSKDAMAAIMARTGPFAGGDYSSVIDDLVLTAAGSLPE